MTSELSSKNLISIISSSAILVGIDVEIVSIKQRFYAPASYKFSFVPSLTSEMNKVSFMKKFDNPSLSII